MHSSRPYFLRATHEWLVDNHMTPHVMVDAVYPGVSVPQQYVKEGKIILNIAPDAVSNLSMVNDWVTFDARFSGVKHQIRLPIMAISAIYAVENGRGMVFEQEALDDDLPPDNAPLDTVKGKPQLKVIK
jgi:stringent starvation protein B